MRRLRSNLGRSTRRPWPNLGRSSKRLWPKLGRSSRRLMRGENNKLKRPYILKKEITPRGWLIRPQRSLRDDRMTKRFSVILVGLFLDALDSLIEKGFYVSYQAAFRAALRRLFRFHGIESFSQKEW